ncbi:hypothetical protein LXA43DRAFT_997930 [Ganoderma leucocontextum]|nr:hypothetical protein LXA43DRAFT_997930 [Ganoderma leucocontextum]
MIAIAILLRTSRLLTYHGDVPPIALLTVASGITRRRNSYSADMVVKASVSYGRTFPGLRRCAYSFPRGYDDDAMHGCHAKLENMNITYSPYPNSRRVLVHQTRTSPTPAEGDGPVWTRMASSGITPFVLSAIKHLSRLLNSSALRSRSLCRYCLPGVNEMLPHLSSLRSSGNLGAVPRCIKNPVRAGCSGLSQITSTATSSQTYPTATFRERRTCMDTFPTRGLDDQGAPTLRCLRWPCVRTSGGGLILLDFPSLTWHGTPGSVYFLHRCACLFGYTLWHWASFN